MEEKEFALELQDEKLTLDLTTLEGKLTARMYAYIIWSQGHRAEATKIFNKVGR